VGRELQIPAMRGAMGDWVFYVTLLPFSEASERVKRTDEVHTSHLLREMIQRALTPRSKAIANYLKSQPQRFFNAVVIGVYGGRPQWHGIQVKPSELFDPSKLSDRVAESLGILTLRGDEKLFAIDGQHRIEGLKEYEREIGREKFFALEDEICAIFVAHSNSPLGLQRTRRLFATLNRYAKPVSFSEIIALDEDDVTAIACRDLLEHHPLFKQGRVSLEKRKSLLPSDRRNFTSLIAMYQATDNYLKDLDNSQWDKFKRVRPSDDETVAAFIRKAHKFWNLLVKAIPQLQKVQRLKADESLPKSYRSTAGGDLLFRPITPPIIAACLVRAKQFGMTDEVFFKRFRRIPRALNKPPWMGVLWDGINMVVAEKNQELARRLILWMINCDPEESRIKSTDLRKKLSEVLTKNPEEVILPRKLA
jgi:DNA sulfur modification protein DndB